MIVFRFCALYYWCIGKMVCNLNQGYIVILLLDVRQCQYFDSLNRRQIVLFCSCLLLPLNAMNYLKFSRWTCKQYSFKVLMNIDIYSYHFPTLYTCLILFLGKISGEPRVFKLYEMKNVIQHLKDSLGGLLIFRGLFSQRAENTEIENVSSLSMSKSMIS